MPNLSPQFVFVSTALPGLRFVLPVQSLNLHLPYSLLLVVVAVVVAKPVVVISLEQIIPIFVCQF